MPSPYPNSRYANVSPVRLPHAVRGMVLALSFRLPDRGSGIREKPFQVGKDEALDLISYDHYGSTFEWHRIADRNPSVFWPLDVQTGDVLAIPFAAGFSGKT